MKKQLLILGISVFSCIGLAACGNTASNDTAHSVHSASTEKSTHKHKQPKTDQAEGSTSQLSSATTAQGTIDSASTQTSAASSSDRVVIAGHSFHHATLGGSDVLVGDNSEGEVGEWYANDPAAQADPNVKAQLSSVYQDNSNQN